MNDKKITNSIEQYIKNSVTGLYLHASECIIPPSVRFAHSSNITYRYSHTKRDNLVLGDTAFANASYFNELRINTQKEFSKLLNAQWVSLNSLSGMNAVNSCIQALIKKDDVVFIVSPENGGHPSVKGIIKSCEAKIKWIPFLDNMKIDWKLLEEKVKKIKPKLILLNISDSLIYNHLPSKKLNFKDTLVCVDLSHYLSMYMLNKIDNLFEHGVDILLGSTHKSFPGPHKGFIALNDKKLIKYMKKQLSLYVSSDHSHHILALWIAFKEFEYYGKKFIKQSKKNLLALGNAFIKQNMNPIKFGKDFGNTHQLWVSFNTEKEAKESFLKLEEIGIYVNYKKLAFNLGWGFRIGIQEVTLLGLKENDMTEISSIIADRLNDIVTISDAQTRVIKLLKKINPMWKHNSKLLKWICKLNGIKNEY